MDEKKKSSIQHRGNYFFLSVWTVLLYDLILVWKKKRKVNFVASLIKVYQIDHLGGRILWLDGWLSKFEINTFFPHSYLFRFVWWRFCSESLLLIFFFSDNINIKLSFHEYDIIYHQQGFIYCKQFCTIAKTKRVWAWATLVTCRGHQKFLP